MSRCLSSIPPLISSRTLEPDRRNTCALCASPPVAVAKTVFGVRVAAVLSHCRRAPATHDVSDSFAQVARPALALTLTEGQAPVRAVGAARWRTASAASVYGLSVRVVHTGAGGVYVGAVGLAPLHGHERVAFVTVPAGVKRAPTVSLQISCCTEEAQSWD